MDALWFFLAGLAVGCAPTWFYCRRVPVPTGHALLVHGGIEPTVYFSPVFLWPLRHRWELIDITTKTMAVDLRGKEGVLCKDNIRVNVRAVFAIQISHDPSDIIRVAQLVGSALASQPGTLEKLFHANLVHALRECFKQWDFVELSREKLVGELLRIIGDDLGGFRLVDVALESMEHTPLSNLDPNNLQDAEGIRKLTEMLAHERLITARLENELSSEDIKNALEQICRRASSS